ncbi:SGNH/GDSL hydrolase family protein [Pseudoalteromonas sp. T1lg23B]|uniref:SGNH/GDSL hydrolase family protein n=1 Tax=Pseudoalteromonas sp. T1lg23B TaxID=2077097 RepID=UPI000CF74FEB|nr:SGNH/GDSL hydrolase family protein [Pseudoalteromonas sp. T1lg23B]
MYKAGLLSLLLSSSLAYGATLPATHHAIGYEGRTDKHYDLGQVNINWPGTNFKTRLKGRSLSVTMVGLGNQFDVLVDGKLHKKIVTDYSGQPQTYPLFHQQDVADVEIEVVKRSEDPVNFSQIVSFEVDGSIDGVWQQQKHILYIGDSISAGFGSESNKRDCSWPEVVETSNARLAFPYVSAQMLGASFTQLSASGLGLIRNWSGNQPHHNLPYYYDKAGAVFEDKRSFEDKFPNLIVLEVGTNDFSTDPQAHEPWADIQEVKQAWVKRMVEFVTTLRGRYPNQPILMMPRPAYPYDLIIPATNEAIALLNEKGQGELYSQPFSSALSGCIWHPTKQEHQEIAQQLVDFINAKQLL